MATDAGPRHGHARLVRRRIVGTAATRAGGDECDRIDHVRERKLGVVQPQLQPAAVPVSDDRPAKPVRSDDLAIPVEDDDGLDSESRVALRIREPHRAVGCDACTKVSCVESPAPGSRALPLCDRERLLDAVRAEHDRLIAERQLPLHAVPVSLPRAARAAEAKRHARRARGDLQSALADLELPAKGGLDECRRRMRRRPDEGGIQRRTQFPRQESRRVVCLRAVESGELGDGERGGAEERGGDREEKASPAFGRGRALGFRRAPVRPQVREARHVFLHPRARSHVAPEKESALRRGYLSVLRFKTGEESLRIPRQR